MSSPLTVVGIPQHWDAKTIVSISTFLPTPAVKIWNLSRRCSKSILSPNAILNKVNMVEDTQLFTSMVKATFKDTKMFS